MYKFTALFFATLFCLNLSANEFQDTKKRAELGDVDAQISLAKMYEQGTDVKVCNKTAASWYNKAAEKNDLRAQLGLAQMHEEGRGVKKCLKTAANWYNKAAIQGDPTAQFLLGSKYLNGEGVELDKKLAYMWISIANQNGANKAKSFENLSRSMSAEDIQAARFLTVRCANTKYSKCGY